MPVTVVADPAALAAFAAAARAAWPREVCGVLGGRRSERGCQLLAFVPLANTLRATDRFACDPAAFAAAIASWREADLELLGFGHSHPDGTAAPSATDRRELWPHHLHLIAAVAAAGAPRIAAWWTLDGGRCHELRLDEAKA